MLLGDVVDVAPRLLGSVLRNGAVAVRVTEVEAYDGPGDPGSHSHNGMTARNAVMFGPPGRLYVYFTYGMHHCCNVVVGEAGTPSAVLLRAGEVVDGQDVARERRPRSSDRDLARGPARLCRSLDLTRDQDGAGLSAEPLTLVPGLPVTTYEAGPRVGLRGAPERPWRFWLPGEQTVSDYRPAAPLRPRPDPM